MKLTNPKKLILLLISLLCIVSCKNEGAYRSEKKISRVIQKIMITNNSATIDLTNNSEIWIWDNNQLSNIQDNLSLTEFIYVGKKISKVIRKVHFQIIILTMIR